MKHILIKFLVASPTMIGILPIGCLTYSSTCNVEEDFEIPPEMLDISNDGVLYGFKPGVTIADIDKAGYNTLSIPKNVVKIANLAFALNFTIAESKVTKLKFAEGTAALREIGHGAFKRCHSITTIEGLENTSVTSIGSEAFCNLGITGELKLPHTLKTLGSHAFERTEIQKVVLPNSLQEVGAFAFYQCQPLTNIDFTEYENIPNWMYKPGQHIFFNSEMSQKGTVTINLNDNTLEDWEEVLWNRLELNKEMFEISYGLVSPAEWFTVNDEGTITNFHETSDFKVLKIPSSVTREDGTEITVTKIGKDAFTISQEVNVIIPDSITEIGEGAFESCHIKGELSLPKTIKKIGDRAFKGCINITGEIVIPNTIDADGIGKSAFEGCSNITSVAFNFDSGAAMEEDGITIGQRAFAECSRLSLIDITMWPNAATDVHFKWNPETDKPDEKEERSPFHNISKTGHILAAPDGQDVMFNSKYELFNKQFLFNNKNLGKEVRPSPSDEFDNTSNGRKDSAPWLFGAYWPKKEDYQQTEQQPFYEKDFSIKNISHLMGLKNDLEVGSIHNYDTINTPITTTVIEDSAFRETFVSKIIDTDTSTKPMYWYINFNGGLIDIKDYAFADNPSLAGEITFPQSLKTIGNFAFSNCYQLRGSFTLPPQIEYVGDSAFFDCVGLSTPDLNIPKNLHYIGNNAFFGISADRLTLASSTKQIGDCAFMGLEGLQTIDFTKCGDVPQDCNWSSLSFYIRPNSSITNRRVKIASGQDIEKWTTFLKTHGLTDEWTVGYEG